MDQVILTCLAKRPADRYQTAADLLAVLEPLATPSTGITPVATRPMASIRRRRWWGLGIAAGLVAVVAGTLVWRRGAGTPATFGALDRVRLTTSGFASSPQVSPDGKQVMYAERPCEAAVAVRCINRLVVQDVTTGARQVLVDSAADRYRIERELGGMGKLSAAESRGSAAVAKATLATNPGSLERPQPSRRFSEELGRRS